MINISAYNIIDHLEIILSLYRYITCFELFKGGISNIVSILNV